MTDSTAGLVKLVLTGRDGAVETPWAEPVGHNLFRLDNMPFYAYGVSADDIVEAVPTEHDGVFQFVRVHQASGNRTVRVVLQDGRSTADQDLQALLRAILDSGGAYEGATSRYLVVTAPPETDLNGLTTLFDGAGVQWEYANPTYEELHGSA